MWYAAMAQLVEHILGKDEVPGPNPGSSSKRKGHLLRCPFLVAFGVATTYSAGFSRAKRKKTGSHSPLGDLRARSSGEESANLLE